VSAAGGRLTAESPLLADRAAEPLRPQYGDEALRIVARARGGVAANQQDIAAVVKHIRDHLPALSEVRAVRPMQSPWWVGAFAACLGADWWIRRRAGLR
jgi:hypothetical protein